jgi:hypothetical protein
VEAGGTQFVAQCPRSRLYEPPLFGQFVRVLPPGTAPDFTSEPEEETSDIDPFADPLPSTANLSTKGIPEGTLYALVCAATTGSGEAGRRPSAYGLEEAQLREEQPQIFDLLTTEFTALHIAWVSGGRLHYGTPPRPPRLHAFVYDCSPEEIRRLTDQPDFTRPLLTGTGPGDPDELLGACLRQTYTLRGNDFAFLVRTGKQLASQLRDDPERLSALLHRLEPI